MISSTSTPDLASTNIMNVMNNATGSSAHAGVVLGGSSPDLVSRKNLGRVAAANKDTTLHKTMDNLHNFMEQQLQCNNDMDQEGKLEQFGGFSKQVMFIFGCLGHVINRNLWHFKCVMTEILSISNVSSTEILGIIQMCHNIGLISLFFCMNHI